MNLFVVKMILFLCFSTLRAEDLSSLNFAINSLSTNTYVQILVVDSYGNKTGFDPILSKKVRNIKNSYYGIDVISNYETGETITPETVKLGITPVESGTYTVILFGLKSTSYSLYSEFYNVNGDMILLPISEIGYITQNSTQSYSLHLDPTPGAPAPTITKIVIFQTLRDDFNVAQKLNQIGDDRFVNSLIRMVNIAEKLYNRCENVKEKVKDDKHKKLCYKPVIAILELIKKRLEIVNRICDNPGECKSKCKLKDECDEERAFDNFRKENIKEEGIKEFFSEWDKDEWHKHKKMCKRFVTDEALKIISEDIDWLIKSISNLSL